MTITQDSIAYNQGQMNQTKESTIKIVITGSVGAGKTTSIMAVSEKAPILTEKLITDDLKELKNTTTTSMDYGSYTHLGKKVHVYGTPGQKRFNFMSNLLTKGAKGLIILISNNQKDPLDDLHYYLQNNEQFLSNNPAVVGIAHLGESDKQDVSIYTRFMEKHDIKWPVIPVDTRKKDDMLSLIDTLIQAV